MFAIIYSPCYYIYWLKGLANVQVSWIACFAWQLRQAKTEIVSATKVAYRFLVGITNNAGSTPESPGNSNRGTPKFQATWLKNLVTSGAKSSSTSDIENHEQDALGQHRQSNAELSPLDDLRSLS